MSDADVQNTGQDLDPSTDPSTAETVAGDRRRRPIAPFIAIAIALVLGGLFVVLAGADGSHDETAETPLLNRPAPPASAEFADGSSFDLSRRKGSWVVLNFFQSYCVPCQREHPELVEFAEQQERLGLDGAELYSVVVDDDEQSVDEFFAEQGGDWPVVYDTDGGFAVAFGVAKVPETWIIDPNGVVRGRVISQVTSEHLSTWLQDMRAAT